MTVKAAAAEREDGEARLWTVREAATYLCISQRHLWTITDSGELPCIRLGRSVRYAVDDIEAYVTRQRSSTKEA
jgi:excisionase family DNA binding protein